MGVAFLVLSRAVSFAQRELIFAAGKDCPLRAVGITLLS